MRQKEPDVNQLNLLFSKISEGFAYCKIVTDQKGRPIDWVYLDVNTAYEQLIGVNRTQIIGKKASQVFPNLNLDFAELLNFYGSIALAGESKSTEHQAKLRDKWYRISVYSPEKGFFISIFENITDRKKAEALLEQQKAIQDGSNRILEVALKGSKATIAEVCLSVAEQITHSKYGLIGETNPAGLEDLAISNPGWSACKNIKGQHRRAPRNFELHGIYGRVLLDEKGFFTNDPKNHPDSIGLPDGHPPIDCFLGVPLKRGGKTVGMVAVANRPGGYSVDDLAVLESLVPVMVEAFSRKKTETALKRQAALIDLSPDAIVVRKIDGTITFWSKGAENIYGWKRREALGKNTHELLHTKFPQPFEEIVAELKAKQCWTGEVTQKTKDGQEVTMQSWWLAEKTERGEVKSILESNVDITARKEAEQEIARLATFPELNPNPVLEVTTEGDITYANPATQTVLPDLQGSGLKHVFFSKWSDVESAIRNSETGDFKREIKIRGRWYQQRFYLVPKARLIRIYMTDINELKQTEQAHAKAEAKLEVYAGQMEALAEQRAQQLKNAERLVAIGQTAGMVGHDIRNPLQAITSDIYLISEELNLFKDKESCQEILESVESINQNLSYINKIVSDLQDFTKPLTPHPQNMCLDQLVEGTIASISVPDGIEVAICIQDEARRIVADPAYMRRILTNLLSNAIQAMQKQGEISISASKENGMLTVEIKDTGEGIPEDVKTKMFTPLFTTKSKGQGLGLAVVKRLVESLNGTIAFESESGKGTKFVVKVPQKVQA